ncbi:MAG: TatD family hydrolase [Deltaproteobacteria bacterium]|nr:TatD family hydrolase [Deltaproteobacteria bacterium]MBW2070988.1 TatD family hydrolase [Deltaproteobacteria bacterium]
MLLKQPLQQQLGSTSTAMIDAHCHIYSEKYCHDRHEVMQRACHRLAGLVISAVDEQSLHKSLEIKRDYPGFVHLSAGYHPRVAAYLDDRRMQKLWQAIASVRHELVAVGEAGPDFHHVRDQRRRQRQFLLLEQALEHAEQWNLPLVVHARLAEEQTLEMLSCARTRVLFHSFNGSSAVARKAASRGFYLSFSALLFSNLELQRAVATLDPELLLVETDSPALSPFPDQPRNEPVFLEKVVSLLAKLLQWPPEKVAESTAANTCRFYGLSGSFDS